MKGYNEMKNSFTKANDGRLSSFYNSKKIMW